MRPLTALLPWAVILGTTTGQTALVRESDAFPGGPAGQFYSGFNITAVNSGLGFAATFTSAGPGGFIQGVWGNLEGGAGDVLRTESTVGTLTQTDVESFFGINRTQICYSSNVDDSASGGTSLDSIWINDQVVALDGQPAAGTSDFFNFVARSGISTSGVHYYAAGLSAVPDGPFIGRGLFYGNTLVYRFGDAVPNMPAPLSIQAIDFDFRFSADGTHHIAPLSLDLPITEDAAMAIDGVGLMLGGSLVREDQVVPPSLGGPPEAWQNFDYCGITEAGDYMFTGDTNGLDATDEFILRNGAFWAREGDTLGGRQLTGTIRSASLSETGRIAFVWKVVDAVAGELQALYVESTPILLEGDPVDWDGDGALDANTAIVDFTGINPIAINSAGIVYFTADVDVSGTVLEGLFSIATTGIGSNYCTPAINSTGGVATITALGSPTVSANQFFLRSVGLPASSFGFFIVSQMQGFTPNPGGSEGNLCLAGAVGRFQNQVQNSGTAGVIAIEADLQNLPQPMGAVTVQSGETWNFTAWYRDQAMGGAPTSNFSDGVEVMFQ